MMLPRRYVDRRTVLKAAGSTALTGLMGVTLGCDSADPSPDPADAGVLDLSFGLQHRFRPFALVAPGFEQVDEAKPGSLATVVVTGKRPAAPFAAIEVSVVEVDSADVVVGLVGDAGDNGDEVLAVFSPANQRVSIEVRRNGAVSVVAETAAELPPPFRAAFVLCENQVTALADSGQGWEPLVTDRDKVSAAVDLRDPDRLAGLSYGYGARGSSGTVGLAGVTAGPFGMAGLRDPHLVQRPDGSAYVRDGKAYLTFTCAGLGFFQQAHWGVFTLDLTEPTELRQVAQLYTRRDGLVLGDHAGHLIVDEPEDRFVAFTSSWGDFDFDGVHVRHGATTDDLLNGVHLLDTDQLQLPTRLSSWDPAVTRIDNRWHVAFVESPSQEPFDFHPALAAGEPGAAYDEGLSLVGADTSLHQGEGTILKQVAGDWYLLASDGDKREYPVYDLSMKRLGSLDAPYRTNIPHPQLVERPGGGYLMVTFDGTQYGESVLGYGGHGDVLVMSTARG